MSKNVENEAAPVPLFTVQAFDEAGNRNERAEQLAQPKGYIPSDEERAKSAAKRCNQLGLVGVVFKAVEA